MWDTFKSFEGEHTSFYFSIPKAETSEKDHQTAGRQENELKPWTSSFEETDGWISFFSAVSGRAHPGKLAGRNISQRLRNRRSRKKINFFKMSLLPSQELKKLTHWVLSPRNGQRWFGRRNESYTRRPAAEVKRYESLLRRYLTLSKQGRDEERLPTVPSSLPDNRAQPHRDTSELVEEDELEEEILKFPNPYPCGPQKCTLHNAEISRCGGGKGENLFIRGMQCGDLTWSTYLKIFPSLLKAKTKFPRKHGRYF